LAKNEVKCLRANDVRNVIRNDSDYWLKQMVKYNKTIILVNFF